MLAGQTGNSCQDVVFRGLGFHGTLGRDDCFFAGCLRQCDIDVLPPIELDSIINTTICKPFLKALRDTELDGGVAFLDFKDGGIREMVVMGVADDDLVTV